MLHPRRSKREMTDENVTPETQDTTPPAAEETQTANAAENTETAPEAAAEATGNPSIDALMADLAAAKERHLRLMADFDNMRKRQARELEERTARANERLLNSLLPVFDNFEMALSVAQEDTPFVQGVKMIAGEFRKVLEQSGAEVIDAPEGTTFDPMAHEALSMVPHAEIAQGCVVNQFRKGWKLGGKVVRPAQVIVSAGAPAPAAEGAQEA
jgi:molecular chaperone GrpE